MSDLLIIPHCDYASYVALPGLRQSEFKRFMLETPAHYHDWVLAGKPWPKSDAMRMGSLLDDLVFSGEAFVRSHWLVTEQNPYHGNKERKLHQEWKATVEAYKSSWISGGGDEERTCTDVELEQYAALACLLREQRDTSRVLLGEGVRHQVAVQFEIAGVLCKCLIDFYRHNDYLGDLKKCLTAGERGFNRQAEQLGYYIQAAWNTMAVRAHGMPEDAPWYWVCAEAGQHGNYAKVWQANPDRVEFYAKRIRTELNRYKMCVDSGEWPAYGVHDQPEELPLSSWQMNEILEMEEYEQGPFVGSTEGLS